MLTWCPSVNHLKGEGIKSKIVKQEHFHTLVWTTGLRSKVSLINRVAYPVENEQWVKLFWFYPELTGWWTGLKVLWVDALLRGSRSTHGLWWCLSCCPLQQVCVLADVFWNFAVPSALWKPTVGIKITLIWASSALCTLEVTVAVQRHHTSIAQTCYKFFENGF